ncbi:MAG: YigZ family protein [Sphingobacteriales bacterium]|nr:YigZ family protein [Sphingobacteriales bacterium]
MLFEDKYQTIKTPTEGIFRDKGSKFIAYAYPFHQEEKLKEIIADLKNQHPKARHWCYAYRLTPNRSVFRVNDDGEPSGTAGRPILNVLLSQDLTNILVVVVRYFGGTLLGVPGLIHAYKSATEEALTQAEIIEKRVQDIYQIYFDYAQMNDVMSLIKEEQLESSNYQFDLSCSLKIAINQTEVNKILTLLEHIHSVKIKYLESV